MSRLTRDGTPKPVSRNQILRRERGQGNINFPCSADHEQDWQPYPVDPYPCYTIFVTIHIYIHNKSLSMETSRLTRDGTAEPVSRDQILRHARGQGNVHFPCSAGHEQDWQPYPVDPYSAICDDHTYIYTCVCVFSSHSFWTSSSLDVPAGVTQEEGHTGFLIQVRALIFVARRIQPFLSLVDREVEFCVLTN